MRSKIKIGKDVIIESGTILDFEGTIGDRTIIRSKVRIEGRNIDIGKEAYLDHGAWVGGGSCWDPCAYLKAGDFLHMGWNSQINTARGVTIGDECGIGIETKIFTHSAYLSFLDGFPISWAPVKIGDRVWIPNGRVLPGITIGDNVVVITGSVINKNLPSGCLAGGNPVRILKENYYPRPIDFNECKDMLIQQLSMLGIRNFNFYSKRLEIGTTIFDLKERTIAGEATEQTELAKNQLRRNGIRFPYHVKDGKYFSWQAKSK
jgi:acetyltransferase-like isoleucine patch superfamily enzyme